MTTPTLISFVRHGHVHNPEKVFYGRLDGFPLSEDGFRQAQAAKEVLSSNSLAAVFSSPLLRAYQTAEIICQSHQNLTVITSKLIMEVHTPFDGQPVDKLVARNWDVYTGVDSQYEQPIDVFNRAQEFIQQIRKQYAGQHVVAVTHGDIIAFLILWIKGRPLTPENKEGLYENFIAPASVSTLVYQTSNADEMPKLEHVHPYK